MGNHQHIPDITVDGQPILEDDSTVEASIPIKICPHLRKCCRPRRIEPKIRDLKDKQARVCRTCVKEAKHGEKPESAQLWMCLACGHLLCGRYDKGHAAKHHEKLGDSDCLMFNTESLACWCYLCDDTIQTAPNKNEILVQIEKYWLKHAEVSTVENPEAIVVDPAVVKYKVISPGLQNLGNTCYFNSVIQVLATVEPLHEIIAAQPYSERSNLEIKSQTPLTLAFSKLLNDIYSTQTEKAILKPANLFSEIHRKFPRFTRGAQQDAQELLHYLLEGLKSDESSPKDSKPDLRRTRSRRRTLNAEEIEMTDRTPKDAWAPTNFVESIFEGRLASVVICSACKSISTTYDQFEELSLSIVQQEKTGKERRSRFRAAIDDFGRRSRNSLSLTRSTTVRTSQSMNRQGSRSGEAGNESDIQEGLKSPTIGLATGSKPPPMSLSEAVSEEEDAVAEKQLKSHTFTMSEAKSRLERLSFGFGRMRSSVSPNTEVSPMSESMAASTRAMPEVSVDRLQYIERLLREVDAPDLRGTIEESLKDFTAVECLENENAFACEECAKLLYGPPASRRVSGASDAMDGVEHTAALPIHKSMSSSSSMDVDEAEAGSVRSSETTRTNSAPSSGRPKHILRKAYKRFMVADLPNILVLHLKRFQQSGKSIYSNLKKVDDIVRFEEELDMGPYLMPNPNSDTFDSPHYRCIGCVVHIGTINSGHYVAYFLTRKTSHEGERQWVFASDALVRPATWQEVSKSRAYLIFYERTA